MARRHSRAGGVGDKYSLGVWVAGSTGEREGGRGHKWSVVVNGVSKDGFHGLCSGRNGQTRRPGGAERDGTRTSTHSGLRSNPSYLLSIVASRRLVVSLNTSNTWRCLNPLLMTFRG